MEGEEKESSRIERKRVLFVKCSKKKKIGIKKIHFN